jgi:uncharacterized membrane protein SpoIIM required for sporulation
VEMNTSFAIYLVCLLAFAGWWLFVLFAGVGLNGMYIDLIMSCKNRPQRFNDPELQRRKDILLKHVSRLRETGKKLELNKNAVQKSRGLSGWKEKR